MAKKTNNICNKITLFIPHIHRGGAEKVIINLANAFSQNGLTVELVVVNSAGSLRKTLSNKVSLIDLRSKRLLFAIWPLVKYFRKNKPENFLSATSDANLIALLCSLLSRTNTKIIMSEHSHLGQLFSEQKLLKKILMKFLMRMFYPKAHRVVAVSNGVAISLMSELNLPSTSIDVIYNPIVNNEMLALSAEKICHPWLNDDSHALVVSVGRLIPAKDHKTLIDGFFAATKKKKIRLIIIGDGKLREQITDQINLLNLSDLVSLLGYIDNPLPYIKAADLLVVSSTREGFCNVIVEALSCDTPVISSDCESGPREILEDGQWGDLFPVGDSVALGHLITTELGGPKQNLQRRAADFSVDRAANAYMTLCLDS